MPSRMRNCSSAVPFTMDWPTMRCCHAAMSPFASTAPLRRWKCIGRYLPACRSSSRDHCSFTGARPPIAFAMLTASAM